MAQYVRDEVLAGLPPEQLDFMLETCVADTLTAPLCGALAGREGAAATLAALAGRGLLVPLDRSDERYRHHRLLSESLRAELHATWPEREAALHRVASEWHRRAGDVDRAIEHALRAGQIAAAGDLVWENVAPLVAAGRTSTAERWLGRFLPGEIAEHATLALTAAGCALLRGQGQMAAHWTAAAAGASGHDAGIRTGVAVLRCALAGALPGPALDAAAERSFGPAGRALCALIDGMARQREGDRDGAAAALEAGARGAAVSAPAIHALCLAELAVLALDADDWELAAALVTRARAQVDRHGLADHAALALVFAVSALVRAQRGRVDAAQSDLRDAVRLQSQVVDLAPAAEAEVRLMLARAALRLGDVGLGREQLAGARRLLRRVPDAVDAAPVGRRRGGPARPARRRRRRGAPRDDGGGAADPPAPPHPPVVPGDRRADLRVGQHGQDAGQRDLPQARGVVPLRAPSRARATAGCSTAPDPHGRARPAAGPRARAASPAACRWTAAAPTMGSSGSGRPGGARRNGRVCGPPRPPWKEISSSNAQPSSSTGS